ncbi:MAG: DNA adenine methylase [Chloroflexota bacterium]|nr:DNA adenine methylase [Chloroflexota bacterium]
MKDKSGRPFLKWAGGKRQLLPELLMRAPMEIATFYEPMCGGAALTFALLDRESSPERVVLNDSNKTLMDAFFVVRDHLDELLEKLAVVELAYLSREEIDRSNFYYEQRATEYEAVIDQVVRFLFLNKTCFNGLYRVNQKGEFNVPHGRYKNPKILNEGVLRTASNLLNRTEIFSGDYVECFANLSKNDFVYFDPPFEPISVTSSFTSYSPAGFGRTEQIRLRSVCDWLSDHEVKFLLSNSAHDYIRGLFDGALRDYAISEVEARRSINSDKAGRAKIKEILVSNY